MRLGDWLEKTDVKPTQFAARIGRSAEAVRRYVAGERIPDKETMPLIVQETSGEVMPNDFFLLSSVLPQPAASIEAAR